MVRKVKQGKKFCIDCRSDLVMEQIDQITQKVYCPKCGVKYVLTDYSNEDSKDWIGGND